MDGFEALAQAVSEKFPDYKVEVGPTEDEYMPPYHVYMHRGKAAYHVHVSEPDPNEVEHKLLQLM